ncbi:hypothetical protein [Oryzibacter oryziterrae]|uniref:hypothetical protein n=1 Tax=Oryzibacter oryziterrae TaxID=2766474 RepID=UPI001F37649B|nr:hypothetical protein [Oryzibacter oryziterrae]
MRAIGRVFACLIGFMLAIVAAGLFLLIARSEGAPTDPADAFVYWGHFVLSAGLTISMLGFTALIPSAIAMVVSETFGLRSLLFYLAVAGAMGAAAVFGMSSLMREATHDPQRATMMLAASFVGGFVYWLIAGRMAGLTPRAAPAAGPQAPDQNPPSAG